MEPSPVGTTETLREFVTKQIGSIVARPCKERKDGAPTVILVGGKEAPKDGPPARLSLSFSKVGVVLLVGHGGSAPTVNPSFLPR